MPPKRPVVSLTARVTPASSVSRTSPQFAQWWQDHRVYQRTHGEKSFRHPVVGDLTLRYESLTMPGDPDQVLFLYTAEPGTAHRQALELLASWTLTSPPA